MTVDQMILRIDDQELVPEFLQRQLPWVRPDLNVVLDVFGDLHPLQIVSDDAPTLTFAYRRSNDFLNFQEPELDFTEPVRRWLSPNRLRRSSF